MSSLLVTVGADIAELRARMMEGHGIVQKFTDQVKDMAIGLSGAFAVERLVEFTKDISELAAKAAGVKAAFAAIPYSTALLADMRTTVRGTVDDLDLMKGAVRAQNLGIPLQDLGDILEFVHQKAITTGGSFQTMSDTLLRAIGKGGRGMIGALEELQIPVEKYKTAFKETGDVAQAVMKLIQEESGKTKAAMDPTLQAIETSAAAWDNLKLAAGEAINKSTTVATSLGLGAQYMKVLASENLSFWEKTGVFLSTSGPQYALYLDSVREHLRIEKELSKVWTDGIDIIAKRVQPLNTELGLEQEISRLKTDELTLTGRELTENQRLTAEYEAQLKALKNQYQYQVDAAALAKDKMQSAGLNQFAGGTPVGIHLASVRGVTGGPNPSAAGPDHTETVNEQWNRMTAAAKANREEVDNVGASYAKFGQVAAAAIAGAISGHKNLGDSMLASIPVLISALGSLAIAQITAAATNPESNGGNYYVAAALVAAGVALVGGIFAGLGSSTPSAAASGGGASWTGGNAINSPTSNRMAVDITFQPINGTSLQAVLTNQWRADGKIKGG